MRKTGSQDSCSFKIVMTLYRKFLFQLLNYKLASQNLILLLRYVWLFFFWFFVLFLQTQLTCVWWLEWHSKSNHNKIISWFYRSILILDSILLSLNNELASISLLVSGKISHVMLKLVGSSAFIWQVPAPLGLDYFESTPLAKLHKLCFLT